MSMCGGRKRSQRAPPPEVHFGSEVTFVGDCSRPEGNLLMLALIANYSESRSARNSNRRLLAGILLAPPSSWTYMHRSTEDTCEMTLIRETTRQRDLEQG